MSSKRKIGEIRDENLEPRKKSEVDDIISLMNNSYGVRCPDISKRLYESNVVNILKKIKNKEQLICLCNNLTQDIWSTKIMKFIIQKFIKKDKVLFIYFFNKFIKNFVFRHEATFSIMFNSNNVEFYNLPDNSIIDYEICDKYFRENIENLNSDEIERLFHIGIDSIDYERLVFCTQKENDTKCEIVQEIKNAYFNQIGYFINKQLWRNPIVINTAIECNFFILQHFCINDVSSKIIKACDIEQKIIFFHHLKEHYPTIIPNQLEYYDKFDMHEESFDKDYAVDVVNTLCDPVLRKTEKGRNLESFYELSFYELKLS